MTSTWSLVVVVTVYIASACALICCQQHRKVPINYILLLVFTLSVSFFVGTACMRVPDSKTVVEAACLTLGVVTGISVYAIFTKSDFTMMGPMLFILGFVFCIAGFFSVIWGPKMNLIYSVFGVLLFSFYLVYDTQLIWGGGHRKYEIGIDDYILGALCLYLDIINIFMYILSILTNKS